MVQAIRALIDQREGLRSKVPVWISILQLQEARRVCLYLSPILAASRSSSIFGGAGCGTHVPSERTATEPHPKAHLLHFSKATPFLPVGAGKPALPVCWHPDHRTCVFLPLSFLGSNLRQGFQNGNKWYDRKPILFLCCSHLVRRERPFTDPLPMQTGPQAAPARPWVGYPWPGYQDCSLYSSVGPSAQPFLTPPFPSRLWV